MSTTICIDVWTIVISFLRVHERLQLIDTLSRDHRDLVTVSLPTDPDDIIIEDYLPAFKKLTCEYNLVNLLKMCCRHDAINCAKWLHKEHGFALRLHLCVDKYQPTHFGQYEGSFALLSRDAFHHATIHGSLKILKWLWSLGYCSTYNSDNFVRRSEELGYKEQIEWFNGLEDRKRDNQMITIIFRSTNQYLHERLERTIRFAWAAVAVAFLYMLSYLIFFGLIIILANVGNLQNFSIFGLGSNLAKNLKMSTIMSE